LNPKTENRELITEKDSLASSQNDNYITMPDTTVSQNRQKKEQLVAEISEKVGRAKAVVCANYQGMTHQQLETLKRALKKTDAELVVTKNTLLKISLKDNNIDASQEFEGATATLFAYNDPVTPLKEVAKTIKLLKLPVIKYGWLEGKPINAAQVEQLAIIAPREVLLAKLMGTMKGPISGFHRALSWNLQKFVMTLKAIETQKTS